MGLYRPPRSVSDDSMGDKATSVEEGDEAYIELSFSPTVKLVKTVRRFVSDFYTEVLGDGDVVSRMTVATHELLENAVRYSLDGNTSIRIGVRHIDGTAHITIDTRNRAPNEHIQVLRGTLDELAAAPDPSKHFQVMMRRSATRTEG